MFTTPFSFMAAPAGGFDPDAQAYINAVLAAGGTLSTPQQNAVNTLFVDLKSYGIYSSLNAFWPQTGGISASVIIEAKGNTALNMVLFGGFIIDANGVEGNGTSGYATFGTLTSDDLTQNSYSFGFNQTSSNSPVKTEELMFGNYSNIGILPIVEIGTNFTSVSNKAFLRSGTEADVNLSASGNTPAAGSYIVNRNSSNSSILYKNGSNLVQVSGTYTNNGSMPIYGYNAWITGSPYSNGYANQKTDFWFWGEGLTTQQVTDLTQVMQNWTINRQV